MMDDNVIMDAKGLPVTETDNMKTEAGPVIFRARAGVTLLIVDPQVDFHPGGSLAIGTANADAARIAHFITQNADAIDNIYVTLDTHHRLHISHGVYWTNASGDTTPPPFTAITHADVCLGEWVPRDKSKLEHAKKYTAGLEARGRFVHCIWPEHCLRGTPGHNVVPCINNAIQEWSALKQKTINYVVKGTNCSTEMFSALCAEVPMDDDPSTSLNTKLVADLNEMGCVLVCGQAKSHCVQYTFRDLVQNWKGEPRCVALLDDCTSPVAGFEEVAREFVADMLAAGHTVCSTHDVLRVLNLEDMKNKESSRSDA